MNKTINIKLSLVSCLAIALAIVILGTGIVVGQEGPFVGIKQKLRLLSKRSKNDDPVPGY